MTKKAVKIEKIFGIPLFVRGEEEVLNRISSRLASTPSGQERPFWIATVNPEFVMKAEKDKQFGQILQSRTYLNTIDGIGLVWGLEVKKGRGPVVAGLDVLRGKYKDRVVAGSSLMESLCREASNKKWKVFFLGGWQDRAERTRLYFEKKYKGLVAESCPGEPEISNQTVIEKINKFSPDILLVAYGMGKQEKWIEANLEKLKVGVLMGVGRSFDYYSGAIKRAPQWVRNMGLEWLYSLVKEPKRLRRQLALPKFVWRVLTGGV